MALRLGDEAPNFQAETTEGDIDFHEWIGDSWAILFSHPADYTPVCTTELGYTAKLQPEFQKRGVKTIAVSVDSLEDHHGWIKDINETQNTTVNFPIIADSTRAPSAARTALSLAISSAISTNSSTSRTTRRASVGGDPAVPDAPSLTPAVPPPTEIEPSKPRWP